MATDLAAELVDLRHDINAKCPNLKTAAAQLRGEVTDKELKLVRLMEEQARSLTERIAAYGAMLRDGRRK
ncbi:MAG: hypothetical protein HY923_10230 [Elusimicrobia bacterium]|nr:hypothetical protein [Elusimicrobiota bacterium]